MARTLKEIMQLAENLDSRDYEILSLLAKSKVLFSSQIRTLFFNNSKTESSGIRITNRIMKRLENEGLVATYERRISGRRIGAVSNIWHLTEQGYRLLAIKNGDDPSKRTRVIEPTYNHMSHRLSVAEVYVQVVDICRKHENLSVSHVQFEPDSWRDYHPSNNMVRLKPDLFLATKSDGYEYSYFIELDLATEQVRDIIKKCDRYHAYLLTNKEQEANGVFPLVLWIVPDEKRKQALVNAISKEYASRYHIFLVITPEELEQTFTEDINPELLI